MDNGTTGSETALARRAETRYMRPMTETAPPSDADRRLARIALLALTAGALGIAFSPIFVRLSELEPTATAFHRAFLALPALWLWGAVHRRPDGGGRPAGPRDYAVLVLAGVFFAGDLAFWHWSIRYTTVANSTLLANFAPIFVTLGGLLLFRERFTRTFLVGMTLAVVGVCVLVGQNAAFQPDNLLGDGLGLVTAMFYAAYILTVGRVRARFSTVSVMAWSTTATAAVLLPVTLAAGESLIAPTLYGWGILLGLALVSQAAGQGLIAYALAHLPAAFSSVGLLVQPVVAALLAWVILGEAVSAWQGAGAVVILAGIAVARRGSR